QLQRVAQTLRPDAELVQPLRLERAVDVRGARQKLPPRTHDDLAPRFAEALPAPLTRPVSFIRPARVFVLALILFNVALLLLRAAGRGRLLEGVRDAPAEGLERLLLKSARELRLPGRAP